MSQRTSGFASGGAVELRLDALRRFDRARELVLLRDVFQGRVEFFEQVGAAAALGADVGAVAVEVLAGAGEVGEQVPEVAVVRARRC